MLACLSGKFSQTSAIQHIKICGVKSATPKGTQKKSHSWSPGPSKPKDSTAKCGTQKGQGVADKKVDTHPGDVAACEDCEAPIGMNVSALQCDHRESAEAWKCTTCLGISDGVYNELLNNKDLKWFCGGCNSSSVASSEFGATFR